MALPGIILFLIGLGVMFLARKSEGVSGAVFFLLGVALLALGAYWVFFEEGEGLGRWVEGLTR